MSDPRQEATRLVKWESQRRWLRRHGLHVPAFMLPTTKGKTDD